MDLPPPPPLITVEELPSEPGCRTLATKTCYKIPISVPKKVPYETCKEVPAVDCYYVLKEVPELECTPNVREECMDFEKKIPFLEPEERCEEVIFDECVTVSRIVFSYLSGSGDQ